MKTKNISLVILAEEPKKAPITSADKLLPIRTENGELMTNRVRSLLREYRDRIRIPTSLILEVLEDRNRKSRRDRGADPRTRSSGYDPSYRAAQTG